jgi:hypothetical protein
MLGRAILFVVSLALSVAAAPVAVPVAVTSMDDAATLAPAEVCLDTAIVRFPYTHHVVRLRHAVSD